MKIIIKTTNVDISSSVNEYIEEKIGGLEKLLGKFNPGVVDARVEVGKIKKGQRQGEIFRAEVNLNLGGKLLRAEETGESLRAAIDLVKDELRRKIRQDKNKTETKTIRGARSWKKFWRFSPLARFRSSKVEDVIDHSEEEEKK
ncbi:MAG: ribosome-associated translation inhibitor RaiA, partial [Patescibacteria group bacterium]|nr:ribosome-associated translation inhibitor RaiA [Patescibacteria group bacterium]MEA2113471.1 ribosome-associated translation inhibitor RaiA [Patescibacteria group bacterium]